MSDNCTKVSLDCPVESSIYGYAPSLAANVILATIFTVCTVIHLYTGYRYGTWTFLVALSCAGVSEATGYFGRIVMHYNVYNEIGFKIQLSNIMTGPAYISAGVYLMLKHIVLLFGERYSRIKAAWYTWIFITGDFIALGIQGIGGGLASAGDDDNWSLLQLGTRIMIGGTIFQVVVLVIFGYLLAEYFIRISRHRKDLSVGALATLDSRNFRLFMGAILISFLGILIRSIYRIPELAGGWGGPMMRKEREFIVLEGVMIAMSMLALTICHPGWCFPNMAGRSKAKKRADGASSAPMMSEEMRRISGDADNSR